MSMTVTIHGVRAEIVEGILDELHAAYDKHGEAPWGRHEALSILREEFEEAWDDVKADAPLENLKKELLQIAMVCIRYLETEPAFYPQEETT